MLTYTGKTASTFTGITCSDTESYGDGDQVSLATVTTAEIDAGGGAADDAIKCLQTSAISATTVVPFKVTCGPAGAATAFGATGYITI